MKNKNTKSRRPPEVRHVSKIKHRPNLQNFPLCSISVTAALYTLKKKLRMREVTQVYIFMCLSIQRFSFLLSTLWVSRTTSRATESYFRNFL